MRVNKAPIVKFSIPKALRKAEAHIQSHRLEEALAQCEKILTADPHQPDALYMSGKIAHLAGQHELAVELLNHAIRNNDRNHHYFNDLGLALYVLGQRDAAMQHYQQALALKPDYATAHNNLAILFQESGRNDDAIDHYRQAVTLDPDLITAHINLAQMFRLCGQHQSALTHYQQVLALKPREADAHAGLATVLFDLGRHDEARKSIELALKYDPDHVDAWALRGQLDKITVNDHAWLEAAQQNLSRGLPPDETITLLFSIGKYYDDTQQFDLAFEAYHRANEIKRKTSEPFNRAGFSKLVDAMIRVYTPVFVNRIHPGSSQSELPVLICGMPRSGTSLTEQIIASHPQAFGAGELNFFNQQARAHRLEILAGQLNSAFIQKFCMEYGTLLFSFSRTAERIVNKTPNNFQWLGFFHLAFPKGRVIHIRRNPVDTCLSIYFQNFRGFHAYGTDLNDLVFFYREYRRLMEHWRTVLPSGRFLEIDYEALIEDQEGWSRQLIEFLGLPWDARCLDFHTTERKVGTASNWQVRQKIYKTSKERWRNYAHHIEPLLKLL